MKAVKDGGAKLICFAPALVLARRLVRSGADAIVIEGSEAGGHIGPVSLTVLAQEILPHLRDVPVFVAGGLGRGDAILAYLEMGASGAQLGTRFAAANEVDRACELQESLHPGQCPRRAAFGATGRAVPGHSGARAGERGHQDVSAPSGRDAGQIPVRRTGQGSRATGDRAFLGWRVAPRGDRRRRRDGIGDGRPVRRHGHRRAIDRRHSPGTGSPGHRRARGPAPGGLTGRGPRALGPVARLQEASSNGAPARRLLAKLRDLRAHGAAPLSELVRLVASEVVSEVCSVYVRRPGDLLELAATEGLNPKAVGHTRLRVGEGIVGLCAAQGAVMNLPDAQNHPAFAYRPETGEEPFASMLAVPVRRSGRVLGVLAVQNRTPRQFTGQEVDELETVAMLLAEMLPATGSRRGRRRGLARHGASGFRRHDA